MAKAKIKRRKKKRNKKELKKEKNNRYLKKVAEKQEIWDKEEKTAKLEEETKKLVPLRLYI